MEFLSENHVDYPKKPWLVDSSQVQVKIPPLPLEILQRIENLGSSWRDPLRKALEESDQEEQKRIKKEIDQHIQTYRQRVDELEVSQEKRIEEEEQRLQSQFEEKSQRLREKYDQKIEQFQRERDEKVQQIRKKWEIEEQQYRKEKEEQAQRARENYERLQAKKKEIKNRIKKVFRPKSKNLQKQTEELPAQVIEGSEAHLQQCAREMEEHIRQRRKEVGEQIQQCQNEAEERIQQCQRDVEAFIQQEREKCKKFIIGLELHEDMLLREDIDESEEILKSHVQKAMERRLAAVKAVCWASERDLLWPNERKIAASAEKLAPHLADRVFCEQIEAQLLKLSGQLLGKIEESKKEANIFLLQVKKSFTPVGDNQASAFPRTQEERNRLENEKKSYVQAHLEKYLVLLAGILSAEAEIKALLTIFGREAKKWRKLTKQNCQAQTVKYLENKISCESGKVVDRGEECLKLWALVEREARGPCITQRWEAVGAPSRLDRVKNLSRKIDAAEKRLSQELLGKSQGEPAKEKEKTVHFPENKKDLERVKVFDSAKGNDRKQGERLQTADQAFLKGVEALLETFCEPLLLRIPQSEKEAKETFRLVEQSFPPACSDEGDPGIEKTALYQEKYFEMMGRILTCKAEMLAINRNLVYGANKLEQFVLDNYSREIEKKLDALLSSPREKTSSTRLQIGVSSLETHPQSITFKRMCWHSKEIYNLWCEIDKRLNELWPQDKQTDIMKDFFVKKRKAMKNLPDCAVRYQIPEMSEVSIEAAAQVFPRADRVFLARAQVKLQAISDQLIMRIEENKEKASDLLREVEKSLPPKNYSEDQNSVNMQKLEMYKKTYLNLMGRIRTHKAEVLALIWIFTAETKQLEDYADKNNPATVAYLRHVLSPLNLVDLHFREAEGLWVNVRRRAEKLWTQAERKIIDPNSSLDDMAFEENEAIYKRLYQELRPLLEPTPDQTDALNKHIAEILNEEEESP